MYGEYAYKGEYHRKIDENWSYYKYYMAKNNFIKKYICSNISKNAKILDAGCGEGVLIEDLYRNGYKNVRGIDLNYSSLFVIRASITYIPFKSEIFDLVLCLDVLEHLNFEYQEKAISEIYRILKDNGIVIFSLPNLAHLTSRMKFLLFGELARTSNIKKHPGDRPIKEYIKLIKTGGFDILERKGFIFFNKVKILNYLIPYFPNLCFLNIFVCKKVR